MRFALISALLCLAACAGPQQDAPVSRAAPSETMPGGMTYRDYRNHVSAKAQDGHPWAQSVMAREYGESSRETQKRFIMLDRDNNGRLSADELAAH